MKKNIYAIILLIISIGCSREIVLRKSQSLVAPYNEKTLPKGDYTLTLYKISYPKLLAEKQVFLSDLNILLKKFYLANKKGTFLIDLNLYKDLQTLKKSSLLSEEELFDKPASFLSKEDIEKLKILVPIHILKYEDTTQEYLNLQISYLLTYLGRANTFDENIVYTEREKADLIDEIKVLRKENSNLLDTLGIELIVQIDSPYIQNKEVKYWDNREINSISVNKFDESLNSFEVPIYIKGITESDINGLIKEQNSISNKVIILENSQYSGYKNSGSNYLFFTGGDKILKTYETYNFKIKIVEVELKNIAKITSAITIGDVVGGKK